MDVKFFVVCCVLLSSVYEGYGNHRQKTMKNVFADILNGLLGENENSTKTTTTNTFPETSYSTLSDSQTTSEEMTSTSTSFESTTSEMWSTSPSSETTTTQTTSSTTTTPNPINGLSTTTGSTTMTSSNYDVTTSTSSFQSKSTSATLQECPKTEILQTYCQNDVPSLVKIGNIWDVYYTIFSNEVMEELLLNCKSGEWCLIDEFDIFRAKMAEKADMVLNSAFFREVCDPRSLECVRTTVREYDNCDVGPRMNFTADAVELLCSVRVNFQPDPQCMIQILKAFHVSTLGIIRKENHKTNSVSGQGEEKCQSTEALMTKTFMCTTTQCPGLEDTLSSFRPWTWFLDDTTSIQLQCQFSNKSCNPSQEAFMIDDGGIPIPNTELTTTPSNINNDQNETTGIKESEVMTLTGVSVTFVVTAVGILILVIIFIKRHRKFTDKCRYDYKPLDSSTP